MTRLAVTAAGAAAAAIGLWVLVAVADRTGVDEAPGPETIRDMAAAIETRLVAIPAGFTLGLIEGVDAEGQGVGPRLAEARRIMIAAGPDTGMFTSGLTRQLDRPLSRIGIIESADRTVATIRLVSDIRGIFDDRLGRTDADLALVLAVLRAAPADVSVPAPLEATLAGRAARRDEGLPLEAATHMDSELAETLGAGSPIVAGAARAALAAR